MVEQTVVSTGTSSSNDILISPAPSPPYQEADSIAGRFFIHTKAVGGFGYVYLCYDRAQDYFYALKTPKLSPKALADATLFPRLQREVNLWITLGEHPHIVQCFTLEIIDNLPFIVAEWVADTALLSKLYNQHHHNAPQFLDWYARLGRRGLDLRQHQASRNRTSRGTSLSHWIRYKRKLAPPFALQLALDICAGLIHAQTTHPGFVHRDLTPANVLLTEQLRAKVTDFGLSTLAQNLRTISGPSGTPPYMAPEQWRSEPLDTRTDIYAFGCILYEMLTGQPPFTAPDLDRKQLRWQHEHAAPPTLPRSFPARINELVQTCLQKDPRARSSSFGELSEILTHLCASLDKGVPKQFVTAAPVTVEDINKVGVTYYNLGQYELALIEFEQAIKLDGIYPNAYTNRGCVYHVLGQHEAALADYAQAIRLGRQAMNAKVRNNRGLLYLALGQLERAYSDLNQALDIEPDYANAYINRALVYTQLGQLEQALADYQRALTLDPKQVLARHNRGYLYQQAGRWSEALNDYTEALKHDPTFRQTLINRSVLYVQLGRDADAAADHAPLARLYPTENLTHNQRQAARQLSRPDPQFVNHKSLADQLSQPFVVQQVNQLGWQEKQGAVAPPVGRMPLTCVVIVQAVAYANWLHESVQQRQNQGQRLTQLSVRIDILQGDGAYRPFPAPQTCSLLLDEEAMHKLAACGLRTIDDLKGRTLSLRNDHPDDSAHPLRISIAH